VYLYFVIYVCLLLQSFPYSSDIQRAIIFRAIIFDLAHTSNFIPNHIEGKIILKYQLAND
jgi:hypothetical protein